MLKRICLIIVLIYCIIGCKSDPKKETIVTTRNEPIESEIKKAYHFFSSTKDLELLYQSDAWTLVKTNAKKIGLSSIQVAKRDSIYFIEYTLKNTKNSIFDQQMKASPSFKNFKEMSQTLTGTPLDYQEELKNIYSFQNPQSSEKTLYSSTFLVTPVNNQVTQIFLSIDSKAIPLTTFKEYLTTNGLFSFKLYAKKDHVYLSISSFDSLALDEFPKKIYWSTVLSADQLIDFKKSYTELKGNDLVFDQFQKMSYL